MFALKARPCLQARRTSCCIEHDGNQKGSRALPRTEGTRCCREACAECISGRQTRYWLWAHVRYASVSLVRLWPTEASFECAYTVQAQRAGRVSAETLN